MTTYLSPLRYPGGKARMSSWLIDHLTDADPLSEVEIWCEPFAGGAGAGLQALHADAVEELWLIDADPALAAFWTAVLTDGDHLARRAETTRPTLDDFDRAQEILSTAVSDHSDPFELGWSAFLINRCSRSGLINTTVGPIGGRAQAGRYTVTSRYNGPALADRIRAITAMRHRLRIICGNGIDYLSELNGSGISTEVFAFIDPPYIAAGPRLYSQPMPAAEHERLATVLAELVESPWVLTYDARPRISDLYRFAHITAFDIPHTAGRQHIGCEYLITPAQLAPPEVNPLGRGAIHTVHDPGTAHMPSTHERTS